MIYQLDMDGETRLLIRHLPPARKQKIKESLRAIALNPLMGKPLQETLSGYFSYRVGALRVIYSIDPGKRMVQVVALGPRKTIYEEVERELRSKQGLS